MHAIKQVFTLALAAFVLSVGIQSSSFAAVRRAPAQTQPPMEKWNWINPMDGTHYTMKQFDSGAIVAIGSHMVSDETRGSNELKPDVFFQLATRTGAGDAYLGVDAWQVVHDMWQARKLPCAVTRTVSDMFGNPSKVCQVGPFSLNVENGTLSMVKGGIVWIITPTVTSNQAPSTGSGLPTWGR